MLRYLLYYIIINYGVNFSYWMLVMLIVGKVLLPTLYIDVICKMLRTFEYFVQLLPGEVTPRSFKWSCQDNKTYFVHLVRRLIMVHRV